MGVGKRREGMLGSRLPKSRSGHTRGHGSLMEGGGIDACVEEWEW